MLGDLLQPPIVVLEVTAEGGECQERRRRGFNGPLCPPILSSCMVVGHQSSSPNFKLPSRPPPAVPAAPAHLPPLRSQGGLRGGDRDGA
jgi:hypothetical protein